MNMCALEAKGQQEGVEAKRLPTYALITPVRDEEKFLPDMIRSMMAQDHLPARWVIVDDGSRDRTPEIVEEFAKRAKFIELVRLAPREMRAAGGEGAITHALRLVEWRNYDFLARFDADLVFEKNYISNILREFENDPKLGVAGGGLYVEKGAILELEQVPSYHVRGALKMYRRECFEAIGGLTTRIGWDTIDEVTAWTHGWKSKSFFHYRVIHRRPTGDGVLPSRIYWERGKAEYYSWSSPVFVLLKALKVGISKRSPRLLSAFLCGFLACYWNRESRLQDRTFVRARRSQQWQRMLRTLTRVPQHSH